MPLAEDKISSRYSISAYSSNGIVINNQGYRQSLVLSAQTIICPWTDGSIDELDELNLKDVLDLNPDVVLLGTGEHQYFPSARIFAVFGEQGIGLEVMTNGALCRPFNILVAEDRAVVAAVIQAGE